MITYSFMAFVAWALVLFTGHMHDHSFLVMLWVLIGIIVVPAADEIAALIKTWYHGK